ncbi:MAG TPA: Ig-like domain-containing protein, partial [Stellaceae bacterium]|nr:Ig-like domain-containing protein [Stellaceae bacterium]
TPMNVTLVPDTTPPRLVSQSIADGGVASQLVQDVSFTFSKPLDPLTITDATFTLVGPNGVQIPVSASLRSNDTVVDVAFNNVGNLPIGQYRLQIDAAHVADIAGNPLSAGPLTTSFTVEQVSDTWTGPVNGGNWSNAANWSAGRVPNASDSVLVNLPLGGSITIDGTQSVGSLIESGGAGTLLLTGSASLTVAGPATIEGTLSMAGGSFAANGNTTIGTLVMGAFTAPGTGVESPSLLSGTGVVTVTGSTTIINGLMTGTGTTITQGGLTIGDNGFGLLPALGLDDGRVLENQGAAAWVSGNIDLKPTNDGNPAAGTLRNDAGAVLTINSGRNLSATFDAAASSLFDNRGSVVVMGSTDTAGFPHGLSVSTGFNNSGTVEIDGGVLTLGGNVQSSMVTSGSITGTGLLDLVGSVSFTATSSTTVSNVIVEPGAMTAVPGTVVVDAGAVFNAATVRLRFGTLQLDADATIGTLTVGNGILSGAGAVTVTTEADLGTGAELLGSGTLFTQGVLNITDNLVIGDGRTLENQGTANWTGGSIQLSASDTGVPVEGILRNDAGAVFNIATQPGSSHRGHGGDARVKAPNILSSAAAATPAPVPIFTLGNGSVALFDNEGTIKQNGTTNPVQVDVAFTNNGTLNVLAGTFAVNGGGGSTGTIAVATGATLQFDGGNYAITHGVVNGAGEVEVTAGIVSVESPAQYSVAGLTQIDGGTLKLDTAAALGSLTQTGGVLTGTGAVTVTGMTDLQNGEMTGTGTTIAQGGLTIEGFGITIGGGRILENRGVANWTGGAIELSSSDTGTPLEGILRNDAGATFNVTFSGVVGSIATSGNGAVALFDNRGTFVQAGTGTTDIGVNFTNSGTLDVNAGTLSLSMLFNDPGLVSIGPAGTFEVDGKPFTPTAMAA